MKTREEPSWPVLLIVPGAPQPSHREKPVERVRSLAVLGVEAIHPSACMIALCPFKNKYIKLLENQFPNIEIVPGTHAAPEGEEQAFAGWAKRMLSHKPNPMEDLAPGDYQFRSKMLKQTV